MSTATLEVPTNAPIAAPIEQPPIDVAHSRSFVILHDLVGGHKKWQCVSEYSFQVGTDFDRLCYLGAIRPAMAHEIPGTIVDAKNTAKPGVGIQQQFNDSQETVVRLSAKIKMLEEECEKLKTAKSADYDPEKDQKNLAYRTKLEGAVKTLEGRCQAKDDEIEGLRKKLIAQSDGRRQR